MAEGEDFSHYMEEIAQGKLQEQAAEEQLRAHQEWLTTTWSGKGVRLISKIGDHFRPLFDAVALALKEDKSFLSRFLYHFLRLALIFAVLFTVYIIMKLAQLIIGKEISVEEEIEVIEEVRRSDVDKSKNDASVIVEGKGNDSELRRRGARDRRKR